MHGTVRTGGVILYEKIWQKYCELSAFVVPYIDRNDGPKGGKFHAKKTETYFGSYPLKSILLTQGTAVEGDTSYECLTNGRVYTR